MRDELLRKAQEFLADMVRRGNTWAASQLRLVVRELEAAPHADACEAQAERLALLAQHVALAA